MKTKVTIKYEGLKELRNDLTESLQDKTALSEQVLNDCNYFVRFDTGALKDSSITHSNLKKGVLVWQTPYALKMYYTGTPVTDKNPNASLQWCEKAEETYGEDWKEQAKQLIAKEIGAK